MRILPFDHLRIVQIDLHKVLLLGVVTIERPARQRSPKCFRRIGSIYGRKFNLTVLVWAHSHAGNQHHLEDVLDLGSGVSHGNVERSVNAEGHQTQVRFRLLSVAVVRNIDVWEHSVKVETCLLTCTTEQHRMISTEQDIK